MAQNMLETWAFVNTVLNFRFLKTREFDYELSVSFSRKTLYDCFPVTWSTMA
jgi:hypothetical protein